MTYVDQALQDMEDGCFTYEGVCGLVNNFVCYSRTYHYNEPSSLMKEQFKWCEQQFGEHKHRWLFVPHVIEKDYVYWFFSAYEEQTLFHLIWKTA